MAANIVFFTKDEDRKRVGIPLGDKAPSDFLIGNEVLVTAVIDGKLKEAVVPKESLNIQKSIVFGVTSGKVGSYILVSFPPSSLGTTT